jgi:hypothetical protein
MVAFQISRRVDQHNLWFWGNNNFHYLLDHKTDNTSFNVSVAMSQDTMFVLQQSSVTKFVLSLHSAVLFNATFGRKIPNLT